MNICDITRILIALTTLLRVTNTLQLELENYSHISYSLFIIPYIKPNNVVLKYQQNTAII